MEKKIKYEKAELKTKKGDEKFSFNSKQIGKKTLLDFWKWSVSDLVSNATRGRLAEFIVACGLGIGTDGVRDEWRAYDLITIDGVKIEVKSAAYMQSWAQKEETKVSFTVKKSRAWDPSAGKFETEKKMQGDVYVFCLLAERSKDKLNPLDLDQWNFYMLSAKQVKDHMKGRDSVALKPDRWERLFNMTGSKKDLIKLVVVD